MKSSAATADDEGVTPMTPLQTELEYFESRKSELLESHFGKFVVISGQRLIGAFDTAEAAYEAGVAEVGTGSLLLRQVLPENPVAEMPAVYTGLVALGR